MQHLYLIYEDCSLFHLSSCTPLIRLIRSKPFRKHKSFRIDWFFSKRFVYLVKDQTEYDRFLNQLDSKWKPKISPRRSRIIEIIRSNELFVLPKGISYSVQSHRSKFSNFTEHQFNLSKNSQWKHVLFYISIPNNKQKWKRKRKCIFTTKYFLGLKQFWPRISLLVAHDNTCHSVALGRFIFFHSLPKQTNK